MDPPAARAYRRRMTNRSHILASTAAMLALAAPVAHARPAVEAPAHNSPAPFVAPVAPGASSSSDGFDWSSAAIGAGGVAGLVALLSAGFAVTIRTRVPSPR
jgi:hypothetical protein